MTAQTDLRNAMIEAYRSFFAELGDVGYHFSDYPGGGIEVEYDGPIDLGELADAILSLLARWECKEPGDCPE